MSNQSGYQVRYKPSDYNERGSLLGVFPTVETAEQAAQKQNLAFRKAGVPKRCHVLHPTKPSHD